MDFIVRDVHTEHDASWTICSSLHNYPVCLGCIVEIVENAELLPLQRKPALTEFHRILTQQSEEVLQLFIKEERIVWHIVSVLLESLGSEEDSYLALTVEALLKLVQLIGSEDLVTTILDKTVHQVQSTTDHKKLLPLYMLLGKMLYQIPALADTLLKQYDWLLHELSLDLCNVGETVQSAIAYIFIFLCDGSHEVKLSARTLHHVHSGALAMLSTAQSLHVLINGLGLLKKIVTDDNGCKFLMTLNEDGLTLLTCLKKLMLSKKDVLQTGVSQILSLILRKDNYTDYASAILESDIVEFLFESLHTENSVQIECILKVLQRLSHVEQFYKRCHSVYGVESVLRALSTAFELKNPTLLNHCYVLLTDILNRHPEDIPLFLSCNVVHKCLSLIQQGLAHHQTSILHMAQDTLTAVLRKKYLLSPVPFQELIDMFSLVTRRQMEQMKSFWNLTDSKQLKNTEILSASLERYLDLFLKSCTLLLMCRHDLTSCESNFAAPGSQEGPSSMEIFTEKIFDAGHNICNVVMTKCAVRFDSPQLFMKVLQLFSCLYDLDDARTCDLVYRLISAGFIISLIEVKVKYDSTQLSSLTQQFLKLTFACCQRKDILPIDGHPDEVLNVNHFKWHFSSLSQVFRDGNAGVESIESYLAVLYISCKTSDCGSRQEGLGDIICSVLNGSVSLEQLSHLGRKHYIYLLSYVSTYEGTSIRQAIPHGLETLPLILQEPPADWYTHDMSMLEWVFADPVLARTSAQNVIEAFLDNTSVEMMKKILETEGCVECDAIFKLCQDKVFLSGLLTSLASNSIENSSKISLCLEVYICSVLDRKSMCTSSLSQMEEKCTVLEPETDQLDFLFHKTIEVLQDVFLQKYPHTQDHNVVGLLQLMLLVIKTAESAYNVSVKVLHHVLNVLSKKINGRKDLERACMLTVLAAVTCNSEVLSPNSVCAIVVQHAGFLSYLQNCLDRTCADEMYCITCDILTVLIQGKNIKCDSAVRVDIAKLVDSVCTDSGHGQVASMNLLSGLLSVNMTGTVVTVAGRIYPYMYRCLYIQLQQSCLQESRSTASSAVSCMRSLICYLHQSDKDTGKELLCQPWNKVLLDVVLDLASSGNILEHQLCLLSLFTEFETGCSLIKSTPDLLNKLMKFLQLASKNIEEAYRKHYNTLIKQMRTHFEDVLREESTKWLKEASV